jgi:hypothetical protein
VFTSHETGLRTISSSVLKVSINAPDYADYMADIQPIPWVVKFPNAENQPAA